MVGAGGVGARQELAGGVVAVGACRSSGGFGGEVAGGVPGQGGGAVGARAGLGVAGRVRCTVGGVGPGPGRLSARDSLRGHVGVGVVGVGGDRGVGR